MYTFMFFSALYLPHLGGVENYTYKLSSELVNQGHRVIIVTSAISNDEGVYKEGGIKVYRLPTIAAMGGRFPILIKNSIYWKMWTEIRSISADCVIANTRYYQLSIEAIKLAKEKNINAILIDHSTSYLRTGNKFIDPFVRLYEMLVTRRIAKMNPDFYSVSRLGMSWLKSLGINPSGVLPNAVDEKDFSCKAKNNVVSESSGKFYVTYAGRLLQEKGILKLCAAVRDLISEGYKDIILKVAGSGPAQKSVKKYESDNIQILGRLNSKEMAGLFNLTHVFCLPTDYPEGFPTVLLEAAICETGIVVSNTGGVEELLPDKKYGIVLEDTSIESIKKGILSYYNNREYLALSAANVKQHVKENYSWDKTAGRLIRYCKEHNIG